MIETGIHMTMREGMLLHPFELCLGRMLDKMHLGFLRKPLYECNICMGGIWTLALYPALYGLDWLILPAIAGTIGCNTIMALIIKRLYDE